ncbi:LysR family transcriptional regulator [Paeniglutamicibacter gangotriensis]|uniref:LysR family transcriptional regulator n=2 Tax=Paeniglutamicibacter gangotriensis TaxID=254787 RepID=M7MX07_9MICC|nr:LysR family transcriptional regulator [Paeniglutamicibacter gangotriensis]EMQ99485.1 LysR family transcriptional regulator [Paeniglutamicibacter gangotriensis Lz1y]KAA0978841.1 LysR family transcriptional regulator [Paeniglutamicibacter gangotriensis]
MVRFSLRQLELLAELPRHSTLGSAASELNISESALSQAITAVERIAGEQLCVRRKSLGVRMTPAGQYFAARAARIVADAEELGDSFPRSDGTLRGPVSMGCFSSFASHVVPSMLEGFRAVQPGIDVKVSVGTHDDLLPALESGELDFALVYDLLLPSGFTKRTIYETQLEVVLHPGHRLAAKESISLAELEAEPLVDYESSPSTENTRRLFAEADLSPNIAYTLPQVTLVNAMIGRGLGYGLLYSRPNNPPHTLEGLPVALRELEPPNSPTSVVAIWPRSSTLGPRALTLVEHGIQTMAGAWNQG